jgi:hypothetical protein
VDWVEGELKKEEASRPAVQREPQPRAALSQWYEEFRSHLERDVQEYNRHRGGGADIAIAERQAVVLNSVAGVRGTFTVDLELQQVRSEYAPVREDVAVPEGEIFTLRFENDRLAIFSADQEISEDELRQRLLQPVLFPEDAS